LSCAFIAVLTASLIWSRSTVAPRGGWGDVTRPCPGWFFDDGNVRDYVLGA
jgi:hypothetical protein